MPDRPRHTTRPPPLPHKPVHSAAQPLRLADLVLTETPNSDTPHTQQQHQNNTTPPTVTAVTAPSVFAFQSSHPAHVNSASTRPENTAENNSQSSQPATKPSPSIFSSPNSSVSDLTAKTHSAGTAPNGNHVSFSTPPVVNTLSPSVQPPVASENTFSTAKPVSSPPSTNHPNHAADVSTSGGAEIIPDDSDVIHSPECNSFASGGTTFSAPSIFASSSVTDTPTQTDENTPSYASDMDDRVLRPRINSMGNTRGDVHDSSQTGTSLPNLSPSRRDEPLSPPALPLDDMHDDETLGSDHMVSLLSSSSPSHSVDVSGLPLSPEVISPRPLSPGPVSPTPLSPKTSSPEMEHMFRSGLGTRSPGPSSLTPVSLPSSSSCRTSRTSTPSAAQVTGKYSVIGGRFSEDGTHHVVPGAVPVAREINHAAPSASPSTTPYFGGVRSVGSGRGAGTRAVRGSSITPVLEVNSSSLAGGVAPEHESYSMGRLPTSPNTSNAVRCATFPRIESMRSDSMNPSPRTGSRHRESVHGATPQLHERGIIRNGGRELAGDMRKPRNAATFHNLRLVGSAGATLNNGNGHGGRQYRPHTMSHQVFRNARQVTHALEMAASASGTHSAISALSSFAFSSPQAFACLERQEALDDAGAFQKLLHLQSTYLSNASIQSSSLSVVGSLRLDDRIPMTFFSVEMAVDSSLAAMQLHSENVIVVRAGLCALDALVRLDHVRMRLVPSAGVIGIVGQCMSKHGNDEVGMGNAIRFLGHAAIGSDRNKMAMVSCGAIQKALRAGRMFASNGELQSSVCLMLRNVTVGGGQHLSSLPGAEVVHLLLDCMLAHGQLYPVATHALAALFHLTSMTDSSRRILRHDLWEHALVETACRHESRVRLQAMALAVIGKVVIVGGSSAAKRLIRVGAVRLALGAMHRFVNRRAVLYYGSVMVRLTLEAVGGGMDEIGACGGVERLLDLLYCTVVAPVSSEEPFAGYAQ